MIEFQCSCGEPLRVDEKHAGRKCKCPKCGGELRVPASGQPEVMTDDNSRPDFAVSDQPRSEHSKPSPIAYLWCRRLQRAMVWTGYLWFVIGAVAVMLFVRLGFTPAPDELMLSLAIVALTSPFWAISSFATAELLGGTVAYLVKHECHPDQSRP